MNGLMHTLATVILLDKIMNETYVKRELCAVAEMHSLKHTSLPVAMVMMVMRPMPALLSGVSAVSSGFAHCQGIDTPVCDSCAFD